MIADHALAKLFHLLTFGFLTSQFTEPDLHHAARGSLFHKLLVLLAELAILGDCRRQGDE